MKSNFRPKIGICLLVFALYSIATKATAQWPDYRGPQETGYVSVPGNTTPTKLPFTWSERENVKWKTPIPYRGWSTPVVMNGQAWLTTATLDGHDFFAICVDIETGEIIFNEKLFHANAPEPLGNDVNCYASPSPVLESGRVYVNFGSYGTACIDTETKDVLWKRTDLPCRHLRGPGSSPILFNDLLILTMDGADFQYIVALDTKTGKTVWKTNRTAEWNDLDTDGKPAGEGKFRKCYGTPLIIEENGKQQIFSVGAKAAYGYDPQTGNELWKIHHEGESTGVRPVFSNGLAIFSTGYGKTEIMAVQVHGQGDVTDTHIAWRTVRGAPRLPSPLVIGDLLFMVNDNGIITCLESKTGSEVWKKRLGGEYAASLLHVDGKIYCFSREGKTTVLKAGREYEVLATNMLDSGFMASPAVSGNALILRTEKHLYKIETSE